jgi:hypothetical protein
LQGNSSVRELHLDLFFSSDSRAFAPLCQAIEGSVTLDKLFLMGASQYPAVDRLVLSAARCRSLTKLSLSWITVSTGAIASLVRETNSLSTLEMSRCIVRFPNEPSAATELAALFHEKRTLTELKIVQLENRCLIRLLQGVRTLPNLKHLVISCVTFPRESFPAIQHLLESCLALESLHLDGLGSVDEQGFSFLRSGLRESPLKKLTLSNCTFGAVSSNLFHQLFVSPSNICSLQMDGTVRFLISNGRALVHLLEQPRCSLRTLQLDCCFFHDARDLQVFLTGLESDGHSLESLEVDRVTSAASCAELAEALPKILGLKRLRLAFDNTLGFSSWFWTFPAASDRLLDALKRNRSLQEIKIQATGLTRQHQDTIQSYAARNVSLHQFLTSLETTPVSFVPGMFGGLMETSAAPPEEVFSCLLELGDFVGQKKVVENENDSDQKMPPS